MRIELTGQFRVAPQPMKVSDIAFGLMWILFVSPYSIRGPMLRLLLICCTLITFSIPCLANPDSPTAMAARLVTAPTIDGDLSDAIWRTAPQHEGFRQSDPVEGNAASERTLFQIAYGEEALFVAIRSLDRDPEGIVARLTRRDEGVESDWIAISLDPHHDRQSGYWFKVYASGSLQDGVYSADRDVDSSWDGIWEAATAIDDSGWVAELRIPYHALRFSPREQYTWGLNVERRISRKHETVHWSLMRRDQPGLVSQFGQLQGIREIEPPLHLELIPYGMGRAIFDGDSDWSAASGADLRYGISSGVSLYGTVNPDFGQVEADPATLNLTAFEDFFEEQRPFFVEGASIFSGNDFQLFHSRRIGRRPGLIDIPDSLEVLDGPESTTILGAVKLTGKTQGKMSFGLLGALTDEEAARVTPADGSGRSRNFRVEPRTGYFVARAQQDLFDGTSTVGAIVTTTQRDASYSAYTGALDWDLKFDEDRYGLSGTVVGSQTGTAADRRRGYIGHIEFDKKGGWLEAETLVRALSRDVDLNDLGFLRRGDLIEWSNTVKGFHHDAAGPFLRWDLAIDGDVAWNYDDTRLSTSSRLAFWADSRSGGQFHVHLGREFAAMDDSDVRRDGPVIEQLAESWAHSYISTDEGRAVSFTMRPEIRRTDGGDSWGRSLTVGMQYRPLPSVWLAVEPSYETRRNDAQWVERIDEITADGTAPHFIYGELESRILDFSTRARVSFTPDLSVELYLQPFVAIGDYRRFKELTGAETYDFRTYDLGENRDFHRRSLKSNLVLRWEFQPGSQLYLVWSQSRSASLEDVDESDLELRPLRRLSSAFSDGGANVLLTKINYWLPL
ncbi:MAG: carbohydrate binding family 9 domain-containing protein [Gemmatimonadetes bacterium]|nr:carbohydrate binding family 9 domain-containing protein [Gemmatimonadota bacterium]